MKIRIINIFHINVEHATNLKWKMVEVEYQYYQEKHLKEDPEYNPWRAFFL